MWRRPPCVDRGCAAVAYVSALAVNRTVVARAGAGAPTAIATAMSTTERVKAQSDSRRCRMRTVAAMVRREATGGTAMTRAPRLALSVLLAILFCPIASAHAGTFRFGAAADT